ncbi:MAG: sulfite exporter TauE/SafE family protein [Casimicrobiaceae bacterium]
MDWTLVPIFLAIGGVVGFIAGLLGIGGGMTMIPLLTLIFSHQHFPPEHILHIAVATSLATIVFTSISSVRAHHAHDAVVWPIFWKLGPGILAGSLLGPQIVSGLSTSALSGVFAAFAAFTATRLLHKAKSQPGRMLPGPLGMFGVGGALGALSSMVGAGGAFISVPFMTACNVRIHNAVATSAALGLPIAAAGTAGYLIAGLRQAGMPPYTVGYINLPALFGIAAASVLAAPAGARMAHRWPVAWLRRAFAALLYCIAAFFFWKVFAS